MAQVVFSPAAFRLLFPEFTGLTDAQLNFSFTGATLIVSNSDSSPVVDLTIRSYILNLLTAHVAKLRYGTNDGAGHIEPPSPLIGRISHATEGSVSVETDYAAAAGSRAWWDQTSYGAMAYQITLPYRTARYVPAPRYGWPSSRGPWYWRL